MRDRGVIYCGLLVFVGAFTFPVWHGLAARTTTKGPQLTLPVHQKECVMPVEFMKRDHMQFLLDRRDRAVRGGDRNLLAFNHQTYTLNFTTTCLTECHAGKSDFCDRCHTYAGVAPRCWNCHLDSKTPTTASLGQNRRTGPAQAKSPAPPEQTRRPTNFAGQRGRPLLATGEAVLRSAR